MEGCIHNEHCESVGKIHPKKLSQEDRIDTGDFHPRALKSCPLFLTTKGTLLCQISEDITPKLAVKLAKNVSLIFFVFTFNLWSNQPIFLKTPNLPDKIQQLIKIQ